MAIEVRSADNQTSRMSDSENRSLFNRFDRWIFLRMPSRSPSHLATVSKERNSREKAERRNFSSGKGRKNEAFPEEEQQTKKCSSKQKR